MKLLGLETKLLFALNENSDAYNAFDVSWGIYGIESKEIVADGSLRPRDFIKSEIIQAANHIRSLLESFQRQESFGFRVTFRCYQYSEEGEIQNLPLMVIVSGTLDSDLLNDLSIEMFPKYSSSKNSIVKNNHKISHITF